MSRYKYILVGAILLLFIGVSISLFTVPDPSQVYQVLSYSDFLDRVEKNEVHEVVIRGSELTGFLRNGTSFSSYIPRGDRTLDLLLTKKIHVDVRPDDAPGLLLTLFAWLPLFLLLGSIWFFVGRPLVRIERRLQHLERAIPKQQNADRE